MKYLIILLNLLFISEILVAQPKTNSRPIRISGYIKGAPTRDTVVLDVFDADLLGDLNDFAYDKYKQYTAIAINGRFHIQTGSISGPHYILLGHNNKDGGFERPLILNFQLAEPGDNVIVNNLNYGNSLDYFGLGRSDIKFSGKGSLKYQCFYSTNKKVDSLIHRDEKEANKPKLDWTSTDSCIRWVVYTSDKVQSRLDSAKSLINRYKRLMSKDVFQIMYANLLGGIYSSDVQIIADATSGSAKVRNDSMHRLIMRSFFNEACRGFEQLAFPDNVIGKSPYYLLYLYRKQQLLNGYKFVYNDLKQIRSDVYQDLKKKYSGDVRDRLLFLYFVANTKNGSIDSLLEAQLKDALSFVKDAEVRVYLNKQSTIYHLNDRIDFSLVNEKGDTVTLSSLKGKIVLLDFWYTGCGWCADYYDKVLKNIEEKYRNDPEFLVVTINADPSKLTWLNTLKAGKTRSDNVTYRYTSDQAVNLYTGLGKGSMLTKFNITSYPHPILLDQEGHIVSDDDSMVGLRNSSYLENWIQKLKKK